MLQRERKLHGRKPHCGHHEQHVQCKEPLRTSVASITVRACDSYGLSYQTQHAVRTLTTPRPRPAFAALTCFLLLCLIEILSAHTAPLSKLIVILLLYLLA